MEDNNKSGAGELTDREWLIKIETQLSNLITAFNGFTQQQMKQSETYVTKDQHKITETKVALLEKIVFSTIGVILLAVVGALIALVLN